MIWNNRSLPPTNKVWGKVIFLHLFVILFTGGSASVHAGIPPPRPGTTPRTRHPPQTGTPLPRTPRPGTSPGAEHAGRYGQGTGSTHPTGMQSCFHYIFHLPLHVHVFVFVFYVRCNLYDFDQEIVTCFY